MNEIELLKSTISKIDDLPKKVSYQVMIPLSSVAFCPGELIHTNEFKVLEDKNSLNELDKLPFRSYYETIQVLKERIQRIEGAKSEQVDRKPLKSSMKKISSSSEPTKAHSHPECNEKKRTVVINEVPQVQAPKSTEKASALVEDPIFEIREYEENDDSNSNNGKNNNSNSRFELIDVSKQLQYMENNFSSAGTVKNVKFSLFILLFCFVVLIMFLYFIYSWAI
jgi:hypothetical protein